MIQFYGYLFLMTVLTFFALLLNTTELAKPLKRLKVPSRKPTSGGYLVFIDI